MKVRIAKKKISKLNRGKKLISNVKPKNQQQIASVKSETDPSKSYEISYENGHLYCNCVLPYTGTKGTSCKHLSAIILNILEGFKGQSVDNLSKIFDNISF